MDTQRQITQPPLWRKYWYVMPIILVLVGTYFLRDVLGDASYIVEKNAVVIAKVEQGNFRVNVRATGVLKPLNIRWVSAQVSGRVEQVFVKAGADLSTVMSPYQLASKGKVALSIADVMFIPQQAEVASLSCQ